MHASFTPSQSNWPNPVVFLIWLEQYRSSFLSTSRQMVLSKYPHPTFIWSILISLRSRALPFILKAMEPLRQRGFLTTFANDNLTEGAITVVGTGNSPLEQVKALSPRDYFFDAPLTQLNDTSLNTTFDITLSPVASTDYGPAVGWSGIGNISETQRNSIITLVNMAHSLGIRSRFWDTPGWPIHARDAIWQELLNDGSDWLNADDLEAASSF